MTLILTDQSSYLTDPGRANSAALDEGREQEPRATGSILHGDARVVLANHQSTSVDVVITDPPYGVRYRDRDGRSIAGDDDLQSVLPVFAELHRVLKPDSFCISFYGWNQIDAFMLAWRAAGFHPVGHIVWKKDYASKTGFLRACHEQAYVLTKGRPKPPERPLSDVQPWVYSGNRVHPTEKSVEVIKPLVEAFSRPGDLVCDPFSGSGSTAVAAALCGRRYLGIEIDEGYCTHARKRLAGVAAYLEVRP